MRTFVPAVAIAALLAAPSTTPAHAQNVPQLLQGLMTGNRGQDDAIREAYERGYQKGRQDEAQFARNRRDDDRYRQPPPPPYDNRPTNPYTR